MAEQEEWRDAVGYPRYEVSNVGRVRSFISSGRHGYLNKNPHVLRPGWAKGGYRQVGLYRNNHRKDMKIATLVAAAFIGVRPEGLEINHIDGVKTNDRVENLEYVTSSANKQHAIATGLWFPPQGENHGAAKLTNNQVLEIRKKYATDKHNQKAVARIYGVDQSIISLIINRKIWRHI